MNYSIKKIILLTFIFIQLNALSGKQGNETRFDINLDKSSLHWSGKKVTGEHYGTIQLSSGTVNFKKNKISGGNFLIDMTSIENMDIKSEKWKLKLENHLKSDDFFNADSFPTANFIITSAKINSRKLFKSNDYEITGILTIKGISNEIKFPAQVERQNSGFRANGEISIDRTLWDIRYKSGKFFKNLEEKMIYDNFSITFKLETKQ
ncbi:MAG: YceI family protein [Candidatus Neomarinimicrobiota bacterium]